MDKIRNVTFSAETFDMVSSEAIKSRRTFKHEAAVLIDEALAARAAKDARARKAKT